MLVDLRGYKWTYRAAQFAWWTLVLSLLLRWVTASFLPSVCKVETLYGFLEVSCSGFPFADIVNNVLYIATNVFAGSLVPIALLATALSAFAQGQFFIYTDQLTVWPTLATLAIGIIALIFYALAILFALHLATRIWRRMRGQTS